MRNIAAVTALAIGLALPGAAFAVQFWTYDLVADCNGWSSDVEIWFREGYETASLEYTALLLDAAGVEVERFTGTTAFPVGYAGFVTFTFGGEFSAPPGEGWLVTVDYTLYDYFTDGFNVFPLTLTAAPDCAGADDSDGPVCCYTADWWRRNPDAWPATNLVVGGAELAAQDLQHILNRLAWGNPGMVLQRQLVAARFNAMLNPTADMGAAMDAADAFLGGLTAAGQGRGAVRGANRVRDAEAVRDLIAPLVAFNGQGCADDPEAGLTAAGPTELELVDKALAGAALPEEAVSLGALKARYR